MAFRVYLDEDSCSHRLVDELRRLGIDVVAALEIGRIQVPDEDHLEFAVADGRTIVSANLKDFQALAAAWGISGREHFGIVLWKHEVMSPERLAARINEELEARTPHGTRNAVIRISAA